MLWTVRRGNEVGYGPILAKRWTTDDRADDARFWIESDEDGTTAASGVWSSPTLRGASVVVEGFREGGVESYVWLGVMDAPKLLYRGAT